MPLTGDTTALLASIRRHTSIPATHPSFTDEQVLADATEELLTYLLPLGMVERQELWAGPTGRLRVPLVLGQADYPIPARAAGAKVRAARLLDSQGNPIHLNYYGREEIARRYDDGSPPDGLVLEGGSIRLFPTPRSMPPGYTLEVEFYVRPGQLILQQRAARVIAVTPSVGGTVLTVQEPPDNADLMLASVVDVVSGRAPYDMQALEATVLDRDNLGSGVWAITVASSADFQMGDWLCGPGETPVVQAPLEWHPLLALRTAVRELTSVGDMEAAGVKQRQLDAQAKAATTIVRPRREDVPRKPTNGMDRWRGGGGWVY